MTLIKIIFVFIYLKFKELGQLIWGFLPNIITPFVIIFAVVTVDYLLGALQVWAWHSIHPESIIAWGNCVIKENSVTSMKEFSFILSFILPILEILITILIYSLIKEFPKTCHKFIDFIKSNWALSKKIVLKEE